MTRTWLIACAGVICCSALGGCTTTGQQAYTVTPQRSNPNHIYTAQAAIEAPAPRAEARALTISCSACGTDYPDVVQYCPKDGTELEPVSSP